MDDDGIFKPISLLVTALQHGREWAKKITPLTNHMRTQQCSIDIEGDGGTEEDVRRFDSFVQLPYHQDYGRDWV